jgi:hypothetical protein
MLASRFPARSRETTELKWWLSLRRVQTHPPALKKRGSPIVSFKDREFFSPTTRVVTKVAIYYIVLITVGWFLFDKIPGAASLNFTFDAVFGSDGTGSNMLADGLASGSLDEPSRAFAVAAAMGAALLLALPVAWVYQLTRDKRGYEQSIVHLMIILPLVVAGIVILVKNSLALAFSLGGIVAAVRFRNSLDDSKDAVYVFLVTGIGLAAAVDIPVATVISLLFNITIVVLWYSDFGNAPIELDGTIAARRLQRAQELAQTGTFVAHIDHEVMADMNREQLEGLAKRALNRARNGGLKKKKEKPPEVMIRLRTRDSDETQRGYELALSDAARKWKSDDVRVDVEGIATIDYFIKPKKNITADDLVSLARTAGGPQLLEAEIRY